MANRRPPEIEGLIGFFVNTLALRMDLSGEPTVRELLQRVSKAALEGQAHQDMPFEQVVELVQPGGAWPQAAVPGDAGVAERAGRAGCELPGLHGEPDRSAE